MVIKMSGSEKMQQRRELIGNRKEFRIEKNDAHLRIVGNDNRILVHHNNGSVDIVGNSSTVKVAQNAGSIQYTGNCGRISLGAGSSNTNVNYTGSGGRMKLIDGTNALWKKKSPNDKKEHRKTSEQARGSSPKIFPDATNVHINTNSANIVINNTIIR
ncbi:uncharacterized protein LOC129795376 [Lutzomyia longipalpis]|uniref:Uncharacterized protein n=1 Tax=Lutzomyia longipalpis TaxID=7200 RepID=A0A1B0CJZ0_LUTLO|nr:uncharacterized protein LOC129795376 [Lutzomyia longipalpis]